jgi:hypothetical protein
MWNTAGIYSIRVRKCTRVFWLTLGILSALPMEVKTRRRFGTKKQLHIPKRIIRNEATAGYYLLFVFCFYFLKERCCLKIVMLIDL